MIDSFRFSAVVSGLLLSMLALASWGAEICVAEEIRFNEQVRPILAEFCLHCHGTDPETREADLRLDIKPEDGDHIIVPGKPEESELFLRIVTDDEDSKMPPAVSGKTLSAKQIAILRAWIQQGGKYEGHWSFEPIRKPELPAARKQAKTEIDRFILEKLQKNNLALSPPVSREKLIRRATFDLIGLPPTWEQVQAFVNDPSENAFEKVVDRLLASPQYGPRWGRHWLDIARYADTHGGSAIGFVRFPFSYTYRDYVIRSFNEDKPYNQFIKEQLAADQLGLSENDPALAGLGFLTVGMQFRNPHDKIDDQIDVITRGLMGLTVACARCHDHKFDAISTRDYYCLYATLASSHTPEMFPLIGKPADTPAYRKYQKELKNRQETHDDMARDQTAVMRSRLKMQVGAYLKELAKGTPEQDLSTTFLSYRTDEVRPLVLEFWRKYLAGLSEEDPVFGPWKKLSQLDKKDFQNQCAALMEKLTKENGDPAKWPAMHTLNTTTPKWNPRVLEAITKKKPKSLMEVADAYGDLFAQVHQEWLKSLIATSLEAVEGATVIPDEDVRHLNVNSAINRQLRKHLYKPGTPTEMKEEIAVTLLNRPIHDKVRGLKGAIDNLHLVSPGSPPRAMTLQEEKQPKQFHIFRRGNPIDRADPVQAKFLTALSGGKETTFPAGKRRLALAEAIVDPSNPLTTRVIVNWIWQHHFGRGLVRTPDDFGTRGDPPTHPKLLDYLAVTFQEDGWSMKKMHKRIMLSAVYQQGSIENREARLIDPDNRLLWRMPRRKLDLEAMRDSMLAVSGELNPGIGGRPFDLYAKKTIPRRTVYGFINRDIVSSLASTFDAADSSTCTAKRPETNVPQQTLFALNSDFIQDRAIALTSMKGFVSAPNDRERVQFLYRRIFSRSPQPEEIELAINYIESQKKQEKESKTTPWQRLAHALLASNEFVFVD